MLASWLRLFRMYPCLALVRYPRWSVLTRSTLLFCPFSQNVLKHGSPVKMMESYIAVLTKGICQSGRNGSFLSKDFDTQKAYLAGSIKGKKKKDAKRNKTHPNNNKTQAKDSLTLECYFLFPHVFIYMIFVSCAGR